MTAQSLAARFARLSERERAKILDGFTKEQLADLEYDWKFWARPDQLPPDGDWSIWAVVAGRGYGKRLAHETPLPTPSGWTTMGEVAVGDVLLDESGNPCAVTAKHTAPVASAYRMIFSDGHEIVADPDHQWVTWTHRDRKQFRRRDPGAHDFPTNWPSYRGDNLDSWGNVRGHFGPEIRTTQQIVDTLTIGARGDVNHCIPLALPINLPPADLPIDPWVFGYWLGNGSARNFCVTAGSHNGDMDGDFVQDRLRSAGYETSRRDYPERGQSAINILGMKPPAAGKVIPGGYLRASVDQRLSLLRGLMDSDGYCGRSHVEFCSTDEALARGVEELAISLSERPTFACGRATLNGADMGAKYRVTWRPSMFNPFSLPRKRDLVQPLGAQGMRMRHRMIVDAILIPDAPPMSCVTVDSPNSMYLAGRGMIPTHNTRIGCEWVRKVATGSSPLAAGAAKRIAVIAETSADARDVLVEGESGILAVHPKAFRPQYEPSKRRLTWPNGAIATLFNAVEPDQLRGPQFDAALCDELAKWRYARETWDMLQFGMRLGEHPRTVITTTPRPIPVLKEILGLSQTIKTHGRTMDNAANLAEPFIRQITERYAGTRLGRQELDAEILDDVPGALWTREMFDRNRVSRSPVDFSRIVVSVDPSGSDGQSETADDIGIVGAGKGDDGKAYVLADRTMNGSPASWARRAVELYHDLDADCIVAERNFGGAMVEHVIKTADKDVPVKLVTASRGKSVRAEPVAALYEQDRVKHVSGHRGWQNKFSLMEDECCQMTTDGYIGERSPNRLDALVWAVIELMLGSGYRYDLAKSL